MIFMITLITGIFMDNHGNPVNPINHGSDNYQGIVPGR